MCRDSLQGPLWSQNISKKIWCALATVHESSTKSSGDTKKAMGRRVHCTLHRGI